MAALAAGFQSLLLQFAVADRARFFNAWLRRIAPDTPQDQASDGILSIALAALPPRKNVGAAPRPMGSSQTCGCRFPGTNPWLAHVAGDPLSLQKR